MVSAQTVKSLLNQGSDGAAQSVFSEKLAEIASRAKGFTGASGAAIALTVGEHFIVCSTSGTSPERSTPLRLERNFTQLCPSKSNVLCCGDVETDSRVDAAPYRALKIKSLVIVPLGELKSIAGVLAVFSGAINAFTETHVALLKTLAEVVNHILEKEESPGSLFLHSFNPALDNALNKGDVASSPTGYAVTEPTIGRGIPGARASDDKEPSTVLATPPAAIPSRVPATFKTEDRKEALKPNGFATPPKIPSPSRLKAPSPPERIERGAKDGDILDLASDPLANIKPAASTGASSPRNTAAKTIARGKTERTLARKMSLRNSPPSKRAHLLAIVGFAIAVLVALCWVVGGRLLINKKQAFAGAASVASTTATRTPDKNPIPPQSTGTPAILTIKTGLITTVEAAVLPDSMTMPAGKHKRFTAKAGNGTNISEVPLKPILVPRNVLASKAQSLTDLHEEAPSAGANIASNPATLNDLVKAPSHVAIALKEANVVPAQLIFKVVPTYPKNARSTGLHGNVVLTATVAKGGSVTDVRPLSGNRTLCAAAVDAVKQWRYKPSLRNGEPIDSTIEIVFRFEAP